MRTTESEVGGEASSAAVSTASGVGGGASAAAPAAPAVSVVGEGAPSPSAGQVPWPQPQDFQLDPCQLIAAVYIRLEPKTPVRKREVSEMIRFIWQLQSYLQASVIIAPAMYTVTKGSFGMARITKSTKIVAASGHK